MAPGHSVCYISVCAVHCMLGLIFMFSNQFTHTSVCGLCHMYIKIISSTEFDLSLLSAPMRGSLMVRASD